MLVTGNSGLLGPYLYEKFGGCEKIAGLCRHGCDIQCDLRNPISTRLTIGEFKPNVVIHAAAITDIDLCEKQPELAHDVNVKATQNLVSALPNKCLLIYISTDQVYPDTSGPHREGSEKPCNTYGITKLLGEQAAEGHNNTLILRTNIFGASRSPNRESLSDFFINRMTDKKDIILFKDVWFSPVHMRTLAEVIMEMISQGVTGVFNLGSREGMSKADFALSIARHMQLSTKTARVGISSQIIGRAQRAADLRMDLTNVQERLQCRMPSLLEEVAKL